ncbi:MAG TPA: glycosyltransferase [Vicinamibacterales bacterium]|nr:glycosyltransferase [Vicinamibacterales bacterium]
MRFSLVIPAYNETGRIGGTVAHVARYLDAQPFEWELLVVIDGGDPAAAVEARAAGESHAQVRVLVNDYNRGKGFSVRRGFLEATGNRIAFIDADLSLPIEELPKMMACFDAGADVAIASRTIPGASEEGDAPTGRGVMSRIFNWFVQVLLLPGIADTQCGFKGFTAAAAKRIFEVAESDRFGFDVEALYLARAYKLRIDQFPVCCRYHGGSSVNRIGDGLQMLKDLVSIRIRHGKGA